MLGVTLNADAYLQRLNEELARVDRAAMQRWSDLIYRAWAQGKFVFLIGNGGSGLTASHFCEDLGKGTLSDQDFRDESQKRLKVLSLTDNLGWIMAVGNDLAYDQIFVQQLMNYGGAGDVLIAISGSGNSGNVLAAVDWANRHGLVTFGLTGYDGGRLKQMQQDGLHVDLQDMGMVESIHMCLHHWVLNDVFARIHGEGRYAVGKGP
ncbi:MAG: SIS domain-containing protein [Candidatus Anammoximicrobium sp.]|nr:SIS domain-containing protein [Candidatus Anammoximicrobium sp.]